MTYFKLTVGFECGIDKSVCPLGYPDYCPKCIYKRLIDANFLVDKVETIEQDSDEKRQEMNYNYIWRKYKDILNIRHIIILSNSGMPLFNMAVGDYPINANLLSGFIQANVLFASKDLTQMDRNIKVEEKSARPFYEFQYKDFNILLRNGTFSRICLILDNSASNNLRVLLSNFVEIFESNYENELMEFKKSGNLDLFIPVKDLVEKTLEIHIIYPQSLAPQISPDIIRNFSLVQRAVFEFSIDLLKEKPYFFINKILFTTTRILGNISKEEVLWNIYQMIRDNIIISKDLEFQRDELNFNIEKKEKREYEIQKILDSKELDEIMEEVKSISLEEAIQKVNFYLKKAEFAKKNAIYQESLNDFERALVYANEFKMHSEVTKISSQILDVLKQNKQVELEFAKDQVSKFEKKKDYIKALKYLFEIKDILSSEFYIKESKKRIIKVDQHIQKLQNILR